jgi:hypothetical protein
MQQPDWTGSGLAKTNSPRSEDLVGGSKLCSVRGRFLRYHNQLERDRLSGNQRRMISVTPDEAQAEIRGPIQLI